MKELTDKYTDDELLLQKLKQADRLVQKKIYEQYRGYFQAFSNEKIRLQS